MMVLKAFGAIGTGEEIGVWESSSKPTKVIAKS